MSKRVFSQDEVQQLIRRAAELESERSVSGIENSKNGLTIDELKSVASEAGLDPELLEQAAAEMDTSSSKTKENLRVKREEIVSEIWLDRRVDKATIDALITELNHIYGTSDELSWWDKLSASHQGKAKVKQTSGSAEWDYKTEMGMYSTRVLMQQRGERFRVRVSKRQLMGLEWEDSLQILVFMIPIVVTLCVLGGLGGAALMDGEEWPGILAGLMLSLLSYPLVQHLLNRAVEKHKAEVADTTQQLVKLVIESSSHKEHHTASEFDFAEEPETTSSSSKGKLRNSLRT